MDEGTSGLRKLRSRTDPIPDHSTVEAGPDSNGNGDEAQLNWPLRSIGQITAIARRILGAQYDYESVASDLWIEMYTRFGATTTGQVPCPNIAIRRRCYDARRGKLCFDSHSEAASKQEEAQPELSYVEVELITTLYTRSGLTALQEELIYRRFVARQSLKDIAHTKQLSEQTARTEILRALETLRSEMRRTDDT